MPYRKSRESGIRMRVAIGVSDRMPLSPVSREEQLFAKLKQIKRSLKPGTQPEMEMYVELAGVKLADINRVISGNPARRHVLFSPVRLLPTRR